MKRKYNVYEIDQTLSLGGLPFLESNFLKFRGFTNPGSYHIDFMDLYERLWMKKFLGNMIRLSNEADFHNYLKDNPGKRYFIVGDYDTDGIMATTIMKSALLRLGYTVDHHIPNRLEDGYGISKDIIDIAIERGAETIITVDNGISSIDAVKYAKEKGLDVIITDHHQPGDTLPPADLIFNPHLTNPNLEISGAFVALKLVYGLFNTEEKTTSYYIDDLGLLAAITTISDMMPMIGENRALVKCALDQFNFYKQRNIWAGITLKILSGLGAPYNVTKKDSTEVVTESTISFYISPTINAQGRVNGDVNLMVDELIEAEQFGKYISGKEKREVNRERRDKTSEVLEGFEETEFPVQFFVIDTQDFDYPINGLIGLAANNILTETGKPTFVGYYNEENNTLTFSGRSPDGIPLFEAFTALKEAFPDRDITGGGHDNALGMNIPNPEDAEFIEEVKQFFYDYFKNHDVKPIDVIRIDTSYLTAVGEVQDRLAPWGEGFEQPLYVMECDLMFTTIDKEYKSGIKKVKAVIDKNSGLIFNSFPKGLTEGIQEAVFKIDTSDLTQFSVRLVDTFNANKLN